MPQSIARHGDCGMSVELWYIVELASAVNACMILAALECTASTVNRKPLPRMLPATAGAQLLIAQAFRGGIHLLQWAAQQYLCVSDHAHHSVRAVVPYWGCACEGTVLCRSFGCFSVILMVIALGMKRSDAHDCWRARTCTACIKHGPKTCPC